MVSATREYDCVVVGGGPAGLTAATVLADADLRVALIEGQRFPRYKIGESMIPYNYFPLARIGMIEKMAALDFPKKYSVQFVGRSGRQSQPFYFSEHLDHPCTQTWQVTRDVFDATLMDNARAHGVEVFEGLRAERLIEEGDRTVGVACSERQGGSQQFAARMTVDASGGAGLAMRNLKWRIDDKGLKKWAIWAYYRGAKRDPGRDEGATTITYLEGKNWFWYIPLRDDLVSVGAVGDRDYLYRDSDDLAAIFKREVGKNVWIQEHLAPGTVEGDYYACVHTSYRAKYCAKAGLVLVGDALSFLDPVFSTGLYLALVSGELAADAIIEGFAQDDLSGKRFQSYGETMSTRIEILRRLVYAFYAQDFSFKQIITQYPHLKGAITDCLIGHLDRDFSELNRGLSEFLDLPDAITHGRAKI